MCLTRILKHWHTAKKRFLSRDVFNILGTSVPINIQEHFSLELLFFWGIDLEGVKDIK